MQPSRAGRYFRATANLPVSGEAAALFDIDLDEDLDLVAVDGSTQYHLARNELTPGEVNLR